MRFWLIKDHFAALSLVRANSHFRLLSVQNFGSNNTMATAKKSRPKKATKRPTSRRKVNAAFMKPVQPDDKLSVIVGLGPLPRTELAKRLWSYIKRHRLQDTKKRTMINADEPLRAVLSGKKQVTMFEMTKLVSKHVR
jgi:upstream activation factor subunit UAF30